MFVGHAKLSHFGLAAACRTQYLRTASFTSKYKYTYKMIAVDEAM